jgi:hypothetical protein
LDAWLDSSDDDGFNRPTDSWNDVLESEYPWTSEPSAAGSWCDTIDDEDDDLPAAPVKKETKTEDEDDTKGGTGPIGRADLQ